MMTSWESWKQIAALLLAAAVGACGAWAAANPYGIAGVGVLTKMGMPPACSEYDWNVLYPSNPINMVRVWGHYYDYNKTTDTINNTNQFGSWVTNYPGKTWIIANEPDLPSQDNLTIDQYARMFHRYYTFIKPLDPTARFAICGHSGGSTSSALTSTTNWYQQVLTSYQTQFGATMPVDVWNVHSYCGPSQIEDPDKVINEFVSPFVLWCHTVQGGAYASCPVWITELPAGEWFGAMSPETEIYFMQIYLSRLERAGIEKWFWFVSDNCGGYEGCQGSCVLTDPSGQVTPVGWAYSALANGYPNSVPPIVPFVPYPTPETALFDFSGTFGSPWFNKGGWWSNTNGELRHTGIYPWPGTTCCPLYTYLDLGLSFRLKINSAPTNVNWAGVLLRAASRLHTHSDSGYLFFVRQNGEANLYNKVDGIVASVPGAVANTGVYHTYQVSVGGYHITCYIDGVKRIDWTDPNSRYGSGYVVAQTLKADSSYDDFALVKFPKPALVVTDDGVYTTNLSSLHATWDTADTNQTGFQYSAGLSAGATDLVPWTPTTNRSVTLALTLLPGSAYYLNVQAVYPGGVLGLVASTDGIVALAGGAPPIGSVTLTNIPLLSGDTTNEARAIIPDGQWAVGTSGSRGFLYGINTTNVSNVLSSDGAQATNVTGVCYRTNLSAQQEIIVSGMYRGSNTVWMTANGGATWGTKITASLIKNTVVPTANALAGTTSNVFYNAWTDEGPAGNDNWQLNVGRFSNSWPAMVAWGPKSAGKPDTLQVNGVSGTGRTVGWRWYSATSTYSNYVADWKGAITPALWNFTGLDGTAAGQAYSVSADGTVIFGASPKTGAPSTDYYAYKAVFNGTMPGPAAQLSVGQLRIFPDTAGSTNLAIPYGCTADGKYAVGMHYRGAEKAVLWDTSDPNPAKWTVIDLTDIAAVNGSLDIFTRLSRAYSIGTNGAGALVIVGAGLDTNSPARTRAFLMTVAPPLAPIAFPPTVTVSGSYPAGFTFSFLSPANATITNYLEYKTDLAAPGGWTTVASKPSTGTLTSLSDSSPSGAQRFYRIRVQ